MYHVRGNQNAGLLLIEYADFECPYCAMAAPYVQHVFDRFGDRIAEDFRPFPLTEIHPHALHAAQAAEAAGLQGKFWQMHDMLFKNQRKLEDADLTEYARDIGLDLQRFERDFSSARVLDAIKGSVQQGINDGVNGTPSFFLNGTPLELTRYEDLERIVAQAIKDHAKLPASQRSE
jgi:protein-disulfide isomerase